jgi:hypothetical protein
MLWTLRASRSLYTYPTYTKLFVSLLAFDNVFLRSTASALYTTNQKQTKKHKITTSTNIPSTHIPIWSVIHTLLSYLGSSTFPRAPTLLFVARGSHFLTPVPFYNLTFHLLTRSFCEQSRQLVALCGGFRVFLPTSLSQTSPTVSPTLWFVLLSLLESPCFIRMEKPSRFRIQNFLIQQYHARDLR